MEDATKADQDKLGERQVASFIKQMLEGLAHLHAKTICHRDIKPQNAMVVGRATSERAKVKLGDFGIAVKLPRDQLMKEKVGTPAFMAPEMHLLPGRSAGYDHKVDLWAMGAVMVFLLAHEYPFVDGSGRLMRDQLLKGDLPIWDANVFSGLFQRVQEVAGMKRPKPSPVAQDLVRCLLNPKRQHRMGASTALRHRWFAPPKPEEVRREQEQAGDDAPMLVWSDFEEGFSSIDREFQRLASAALDAAESAFGNVQVGLLYIIMIIIIVIIIITTISIITITNITITLTIFGTIISIISITNAQVGLSDIQHIPMLDPEDDYCHDYYD